LVDRGTFAAYCQTWARWHAAEAIIAKKGMTFETPNGYAQQRPEVAISQRAAALMTRLAQEFGLTPSSRTRIEAPNADPDEDDFDEFLNRGKG
ncbi:hypothetical protein LCGC14_2357790, partial [marine sediment metagenome]